MKTKAFENNIPEKLVTAYFADIYKYSGTMALMHSVSAIFAVNNYYPFHKIVKADGAKYNDRHSRRSSFVILPLLHTDLQSPFFSWVKQNTSC